MALRSSRLSGPWAFEKTSGKGGAFDFAGNVGIAGVAATSSGAKVARRSDSQPGQNEGEEEETKQFHQSSPLE